MGYQVLIEVLINVLYGYIQWLCLLDHGPVYRNISGHVSYVSHVWSLALVKLQ
jgi:hypothetical protein